MKYSDIKDIAAIDAARKDLAVKMEAQKARLSTCWEETRESYTPLNLTATAIKNISGIIPFDKAVLYAVRALKTRLTDKCEKKEPEQPAAEQTEEEAAENL